MATLGQIVSRMRAAGESQEAIDQARAEYERINPPKPSTFSHPAVDQAKDFLDKTKAYAPRQASTGPEDFFGGFHESLASGEALNAGLQGLKGFAKGAIYDLPSSIYGAGKTAAGLLSFGQPQKQVEAGREFFEGLKNLPSHVWETTKRAGSDPEAFGRMTGQLMGQPAVAELAMAGALAPKTRMAGAKLVEGTGKLLSKAQPTSAPGNFPVTKRAFGLRTAARAAGAAGRGLQGVGERMRIRAATATPTKGVPVKGAPAGELASEDLTKFAGGGQGRTRPRITKTGTPPVNRNLDPAFVPPDTRPYEPPPPRPQGLAQEPPVAAPVTPSATPGQFDVQNIDLAQPVGVGEAFPSSRSQSRPFEPSEIRATGEAPADFELGPQELQSIDLTEPVGPSSRTTDVPYEPNVVQPAFEGAPGEFVAPGELQPIGLQEGGPSMRNQPMPFEPTPPPRPYGELDIETPTAGVRFDRRTLKRRPASRFQNRPYEPNPVQPTTGAPPGEFQTPIDLTQPIGVGEGGPSSRYRSQAYTPGQEAEGIAEAARLGGEVIEELGPPTPPRPNPSPNSGGKLVKPEAVPEGVDPVTGEITEPPAPPPPTPPPAIPAKPAEPPPITPPSQAGTPRFGGGKTKRESAFSRAKRKLGSEETGAVGRDISPIVERQAADKAARSKNPLTPEVPPGQQTNRDILDLSNRRAAENRLAAEATAFAEGVPPGGHEFAPDMLFTPEELRPVEVPEMVSPVENPYDPRVAPGGVVSESARFADEILDEDLGFEPTGNEKTMADYAAEAEAELANRGPVVAQQGGPPAIRQRAAEVPIRRGGPVSEADDVGFSPEAREAGQQFGTEEGPFYTTSDVDLGEPVSRKPGSEFAHDEPATTTAKTRKWEVHDPSGKKLGTFEVTAQDINDIRTNPEYSHVSEQFKTDEALGEFLYDNNRRELIEEHGFDPDEVKVKTTEVTPRLVKKDKPAATAPKAEKIAKAEPKPEAEKAAKPAAEKKTRTKKAKPVEKAAEPEPVKEPEVELEKGTAALIEEGSNFPPAGQHGKVVQEPIGKPNPNLPPRQKLLAKHKTNVDLIQQYRRAGYALTYDAEGVPIMVRGDLVKTEPKPGVIPETAKAEPPKPPERVGEVRARIAGLDPDAAFAPGGNIEPIREQFLNMRDARAKNQSIPDEQYKALLPSSMKGPLKHGESYESRLVELFIYPERRPGAAPPPVRSPEVEAFIKSVEGSSGEPPVVSPPREPRTPPRQVEAKPAGDIPLLRSKDVKFTNPIDKMRKNSPNARNKNWVSPRQEELLREMRKKHGDTK